MFGLRSRQTSGEVTRKEQFVELRAEAAGLTDRGCVRRSNQDAFALRNDLGLYVVCDGMGGVAGGEVASALATEAFVGAFAKEMGTSPEASQETVNTALRRAAWAAHRAVRSRASEHTGLRGMGTTLVAAHVAQERMTVLNVGDSRAYLVREGAARQITADHSWVAERVRQGLMTAAQAERSSYQSLITRAVGTDGEVVPDLFAETLEAGDALLLTSDGLTRHVRDAEIADALGRPERELTVLCRSLIERAKRRGGSDNITCVMVRMSGVAAEESGYSANRGAVV